MQQRKNLSAIQGGLAIVPAVPQLAVDLGDAAAPAEHCLETGRAAAFIWVDGPSVMPHEWAYYHERAWVCW